MEWVRVLGRSDISADGRWQIIPAKVNALCDGLLFGGSAYILFDRTTLEAQCIRDVPDQCKQEAERLAAEEPEVTERSSI